MSEAFDYDFDPDFDPLPEPVPYVPNPVEVQLYPDATAAWTVSVPPSAATAGVLALLDPARLSQAGRVDALMALDRLQAWAAALQIQVITALVEDPCSQSPAPRLDRGWAKEDVKACLGESVSGAQHRIRVAGELVHRLPDTLAALEAGRIGARHAVAVADTTRTLDDVQAREVEQMVLPDPARVSDPPSTLASFHKKLCRAADKADPRTAQQRAAQAAEDRDVWVMPQNDSMAFLGASLPAEGAATVMAAVHAKAEQITRPDDPRTKAQRRADGLVQICADYLTGPTVNTTGEGKIKVATVPTRPGAQAPRYHRLAPRIQVCVALSTLLGLDEQPGELDGHGPIPADVARRLAADPSGTWRRLLTDEQGHLVDYGRRTYKPPADLAQYVIARDRTCRGPGCERPTAQSDLHHVTPWSKGGQTNAENLTPACERHHYAVHDAGWQVTRSADGTTEWISPTGHTYQVPPATYPVDTTRKIKNDTLRPGEPDGPEEQDERPLF